jgi:hypothetical protein
MVAEVMGNGDIGSSVDQRTNKGKDAGGIILTKGELYHIVEALELHK